VIHIPIPLKPHSSISSIIRLPLPKSIRQPAAHDIRQAQPDRRAAHQPSGAELAAESLLPPAGEDEVRGAPGGGEARAVLFEAVDVEVGAEEEDGREEHGHGLEGAGVLGDDEGCEEGCWEGVFWRDTVSSGGWRIGLGWWWWLSHLPMLWRIAVRPAWLVLRGSFLALAFWLVEGE
jgi:hypothetical protein